MTRTALLSVLSAGVLLTACSETRDAEMSRADVEHAVASGIEGLSDQLVSADEMERIVRSALDDVGLTAVEVRSAVREEVSQFAARSTASTVQAAPDAPSKSAPAEYTKHIVEEAIGRYEADGRNAMIEHYSSAVSVDGPWYVSVIGEDDLLLAHPEPERVGLDIKGPLGTDVNGFVFGEQMLTADEHGKWVPYVYLNPRGGTLGDDGDFELKVAWVVRHDGLLFTSGWYLDVETFLPQLITEAADEFRSGGLDQVLAFYNSPGGIATGLVPTVEYYNSTDALGGFLTGIIAAPDGKILSHIDPSLIGTDIEDLLGPAVSRATRQGTWITAQDNPDSANGPSTMRMFAADADGTFIGAGWYRASDE